MNFNLPRVLLAGVLLAATLPTRADISISINIAPPELPVYSQPPCPDDGYLWVPGYWAYADDGGYYWVPGTWVLAPQPNYLWTPAWWGWDGGVYVFHAGYWGPHVGFYGGVNYGYGYGGHGYEGGRWDGGHFAYNTAVNNVNVTNIHNTYNTTVVNNVSVSRVSFNGGSGGVQAEPTVEEKAAEHETHVPPTGNQTSHQEAARSNPQQHFDANHGRPSVAATAHPGEMSGPGAKGERGAEGNPSGAPAHPVQPLAAHAPVPPHPNTMAHTQGAPPPRAQPQQPHPQPHPRAAPHPAPPHPAPEHHEGGEGEHR